MATLPPLFLPPGRLVTRRAALAHGISGRQLDGWVRAGVLHVVRRGVYVDGSHPPTLVTRAERQRLRDDAACLRITLPHVRSHTSAAVVLGLPVLLPDIGTTHVTRAGLSGSRNRFGVKHHLAPYRPDQVRVVDGVAVLEPARTAVDIAREEGVLPGLVAMDSALRLGTTRAELENAFDAMHCWPGSTSVRAAIDRCDAGSESLAETLGRDLVEEVGRGRPETQFGLSRGGRTAFADLRVGRHLIEIDGYLKYLPDDAAGRRPEEVVFQEKLRQDWLCGFKLGMTRLTWADVWGPGRGPARERLARDIADTEARFGSSIDDLLPYVVRRHPLPG